MVSLIRRTSLLFVCALAACAALAGTALAAPAEEQYRLDLPQGGDREAGREGPGVPAASAEDGGLPILLVILGGTALAGASVAIMRRQKT